MRRSHRACQISKEIDQPRFLQFPIFTGVFMKIIFGAIVLFSSGSVYAGTCDLVSGSFKTTTSECQYSTDGINFYNEGYKDINVAYSEQTFALKIVMNVSYGAYTLNYIADGKERAGRPMYEGDKYTAQCENNHIHTRAVMSALKYPMLTDFTMTADGKMFYRQTFEGDRFVRICNMNRI